MQKKRIATEMFTESSMPIVLRFTLYTLVIFSFTASLPLIIQYGGITVFKENGPIEWLQFGLLVGASAIFLAGSFVVPVFRQLFLLLASVSAFGVVRELDALLDDMIPWIGWKIGHVIVLYAVGLAYVNRGILKRQTTQFISSHAFTMLWAGFIVAIPFSQLVGHGPFLQLLMGDDYSRYYKRVIEESGELLGYFLLFVGSVESMMQMKVVQLGNLATSGTEEKRGFGLGLAGAKSIIEAHGGHVRVDSEPGKGSVFTVVLPKAGSSEGGQ